MCKNESKCECVYVCVRGDSNPDHTFDELFLLLYS